MIIVIGGVAIAVEIALVAAIGAAVALWYVAQVLRNSGGDWIGLVQDVRWGAHQWIDDRIGWLRGAFFDWGSAVVDYAHGVLDRVTDQALRGGEVLYNWGNTLAGVSDEIQWRARDAANGYRALADWILRSHNVQVTDMPIQPSGDPLPPATYTNIRVGQVEALTTGEIASVRTYVDARDGQIESWTTGELASARTYVDARDGQIEAWTTGEVATVRSWAEVRFGQFDEWVTGEFVSVRQFIDLTADALRSFASAVAAQAVAPVLEWIAGWQALLEWLRSVFPEIAAFLLNPWAWLFARAGATLWYLVEGWLKRVWDGEAYLPDP